MRSEQDGDAHLGLSVDAAYKGMLNAGNYSGERGELVIEFMPRDHGHLPEPTEGARVTLWGAYVLDTDHGWHELHPVWTERLDGYSYASGPEYGGDPGSARSYDAIDQCQTHSGAGCDGYGGAAATPAHRHRAHHRRSPARSSSSSSSNCDPNYKGACLDPNASDYDCAGGSGNGPKYVQGPIRVVGDDHYDLDSNGDGTACEPK